jgi:Type I phosphodiesterase / nucleotide pyrophosphatase
LPEPLRAAEQVVLLVLDGLGWLQLRQRGSSLPVMGSLEGRPITSVAPTTTATALTSLSLGMVPAAHGLIGYKFLVEGPSGKEVLNALRWTTASGDARRFFPPEHAQPSLAFGGASVPVVTRKELSGSGFTLAHQRGAREVPWVVASSAPVLVRRLLAEGEALVYAYYDGVDRVAHMTGLGEFYAAELRYVDRVVKELADALPPGAALAITADHGQVEVGKVAAPLANDVVALSTYLTGEARFRWLHAAQGQEARLLQAAFAHYGDEAWVATRDEVVAAGVFGGVPNPDATARLGDVAVVPFGNRAYLTPGDGDEARLVCRHGGLLPAELQVPLLCAPA